MSRAFLPNGAWRDNARDTKSRLQDGAQCFEHSLRLVVIQDSVLAELTLPLARLAAKQVATEGFSMLRLSRGGHRKAFLDSLVRLLLRHDGLVGEGHKF